MLRNYCNDPKNAPEHILNDFDSVKEMVLLRPLCLRYASNELKSDANIILNTLKNNREEGYKVVLYMNKTLYLNDEIMYEIVSRYPFIIKNIPIVFLSNKDFCIKVIKRGAKNIYHYLPKHLQQDNDILQLI
jgi:hypothetical protein